MRFFLFPIWVCSLVDAPEEGEAEEGRLERGEAGHDQHAPPPPSGANNSSSDDDNEAPGHDVLEGPAGVVRTMEVLGEPLLEVIPQGFTKDVVTLEDGNLNQWPQLSVRIDNLLLAA